MPYLTTSLVYDLRCIVFRNTVFMNALREHPSEYCRASVTKIDPLDRKLSPGKFGLLTKAYHNPVSTSTLFRNKPPIPEIGTLSTLCPRPPCQPLHGRQVLNTFVGVSMFYRMVDFTANIDLISIQATNTTESHTLGMHRADRQSTLVFHRVHRRDNDGVHTYPVAPVLRSMKPLILACPSKLPKKQRLAVFSHRTVLSCLA